MIRRMLLSSTASVAAAFLFLVAPASGVETVDPDVTEESVDADAAVDFSDRVLLIETLDRYGDTALQVAEGSLADANQALADAVEAGDQEEVDRLTNEVIPELEAEVARNTAFTENVAVIVGEMTDEQVVALNRALQNTRSNGIVPTLGLDDLQRIVDEAFNDQQIQFFVKAYREDAKFLAKADRFDVDSKQYARALAKAANQKEKFLGKVDRFAGAGATPLAEDDGALDDLTRSLAAKQARAQAKDAAKASARGAAKDFAQNETRNAAKKQAVKLAKEDGAKGAKGLAKQKNK